jgi:hypothetical protein
MLRIRSILTFLVLLFAVAPLLAFQFPLSETASRNAYFLGQRRDITMAEFLARYSRHLPPPKSGPYISDVQFFTPFAQLVQYSSRQGMYNAQQAEIDGRTKFSSVQINVYIGFTPTYGPYIPQAPASNSSTSGMLFRRGDFWRNFKFRVLDATQVREPSKISGEPMFRCSVDDCVLVGVVVHLYVPGEAFESDSATVEVKSPDGQFVSVDFDVASLR